MASFGAAPAAVAHGHHHHHRGHHSHHLTRHQKMLKRELYRLRVCESSDNYRANTGNGYYGAYQFALGTWHGLGFHGRPDLAKPRVQDHAALRLHHRSGWRSWPACSRRAHLR